MSLWHPGLRARKTLYQRAMLATALALLSGCATYRPLPLPATPSTAASVHALRGGAGLPVPLRVEDVQQLVLLNNPDLLGRYARHDAARAQAAQAGVVPNPVLGGSIGYLLSGVGDATAWTASLSQDIGALVTLAPRRESAHATADAVDASLLWEAWQMLGKARLLTIGIVEDERQLTWQQQAVDALDLRASRLRAAIAAGELDRASVATDLTAASDARVALNDLQQRCLDERQQLAALMGLSPQAPLPLTSDATPAAIDAGAVARQSQQLAGRRPDLVALQLGYKAQEATLRAAVLAQFPAFTLGYNASQDNSRVRNGGPAISLELPVFDQHRHAIDEATATRQQLHDEYAARVAAAKDEVQALLARHQQGMAQRDVLTRALQDDLASADHAQRAAEQGHLDLRTSTDLQTAALARRVALAALDRTLLEQEAALDVLLGHGMPSTLAMEAPAP